MNKVLTDSTFWIDLVDYKKSDKKEKANLLYEKLRTSKLYFPFPCFYEVIRTRLIKEDRKINIFYLDDILITQKIEIISDNDYKESALEELKKLHVNNRNYPSFSDLVIRHILDKNKNSFDFFITNNIKDFKDVVNWRKTKVEEY